MNTTIRSGLILSVLTLGACGGGNAPAPQAQAGPQPQSLQAARPLTSAPVAASYNDMVQQIYVAYFGRPADAGGLAYFEGLFLGAGAPTTLAEINRAYNGNPAIRSMVDTFGNSQESADLYPGDNDTFVLAIYGNLFNRVADDAGKAYWANLINTGAMTRANAAISIMAGAQGSDLSIVNNKTRVASDFTAAVTTPLQAAGYSGLAANVVVRTMLGTVGASTDAAGFAPTIATTLAGLSATAGANSYAQVADIIHNRCIGCHAAHPTIAGFSPAPLGIKFDSPAQIHSQASLIYQNAVQTQFMPYGNITGMTDAERATVGAWYELGAP